MHPSAEDRGLVFLVFCKDGSTARIEGPEPGATPGRSQSAAAW
jgi:hypothetical protein